MRIHGLAVRRAFFLAGLLGLPFLAGSSTGLVPPIAAKAPGGPTYEPDRVLVKFRVDVPATLARAVLERHGAAAVRQFTVPRRLADSPLARWWSVRLRPGTQVKRALGALSREPAVEVAEPNYRLNTAALPDDPRLPELWGLHNIGQSEGVPDADIDAAEAWDISAGSPEVVVGVIDTGIDYMHPDLAANIWTNPGEVANNGVDDDANGYVDDVRGYDFCNGDPDPFDDNGHGTHVAGTIAAAGNNGIGVVGVTWNSKVMALKFLCGNGGGFADRAADAVLYSIDMGARLTNNSWGGGAPSQLLADAIQAADDAGALFVAAAGNAAANVDKGSFYPAGYDLPNVLAVAATTRTDALASFSNYGARTVALGAPGQEILSAVPPSMNVTGYESLSGTSMASPHVAGAAALLLAQSPDLTPLRLKALLMNTADPLVSLEGRTISGGRLNLHRSLTCTPTTLSLASLSHPAGFTAYVGESTPIRAMVSACDQLGASAVVEATFDNGEGAVTLFDDGAHGDWAAGDGVFGGDWTPQAAGAVTMTLSAIHPQYGSAGKPVSGTVRPIIQYQHASVPFNWDDVAGATAWHVQDDAGIGLTLDFPVTFYGIAYDQITISDNGYVAFTFEGRPWYWFNDPIPDGSPPDNVLAPFWDDLDPSERGTIYVKYSGSAPNRALAITWSDVPYYFYGGAVSFQLVLREGSRAIEYRYRDVVFSDPPAGWFNDHGGSATVGVENDDGHLGAQYSYNEAALENATALLFYPPGESFPIADAGGPYAGAVQAPVAFDGSASRDTGGLALAYRWDLGDGATSTEAQPVHAYERSGLYQATLVVNNGTRDSTPSAAHVHVAGSAPNAPPAAADDAYEAVEDEPVVMDVLANDGDPNDDHLLITQITAPSEGGSARAEGGRVHYLPPPNFSGVETFSYTISDGLQEATAAVTVSVAAVDDPPVAPYCNPVSTTEDQAISFEWSCGSDPDGTPVTLVSVGPAAYGTVRIWQPGWVEYHPAANFNGWEYFQYTVSDGTATATGWTNIRVSAVNDAPTAVDDELPAVEDGGAYLVPVLANDSDAEGDSFSLTAVTQPSHGTAELVGDQVRYVSNADYHGSDAFAYTVTDSHGAATSGYVAVQVASVNDGPPLALDDSVTMAEDSTFTSLDVLANDTDPDADLLYLGPEPLAGSAGGQVFASHDHTGVYYAPAPDFSGSETFTYRVYDGQGGSATATVTVTVEPLPDNPVARDDFVYLGEDGAADIDVLANDTDADGETVALMGIEPPASGGIVTIVGNRLHYQPPAEFSGDDTFRYYVGDGHGGSDEAWVVARVLAINDPPVAGADAAEVPEDANDQLLEVLANDSDVEGDAIRITAVSAGSAGGSTAILLDGTHVAYHPAPDFSGTETFQYTASDGQGAFASGLVTITVQPVNDAPVAGDDGPFTVNEDSSHASAAPGVLANDHDVEDPITAVLVAAPAHAAAFALNPDGSFSYTPRADYAGPDLFTYRASDATDESDIATVTLYVIPVAEPRSTKSDNSAGAGSWLLGLFGLAALRRRRFGRRRA